MNRNYLLNLAKQIETRNFIPRTLSQCYNNYSQSKYRAYAELVKKADKLCSSCLDYGVVSYNNYMFTFAMVYRSNEDGVKYIEYITPINKYKVVL